jgi:tRNA A37 methylthiotransferase MiaB
MRSRLGSRAEVLVESASRRSGKEVLGRTQADEMVAFEDLPGTVGNFALVELCSLKGNTFKGRRIG